MNEGLPLGKGLVQSAEASMVFSSSRHQDPKGSPESATGKLRSFGFLEFNFSSMSFARRCSLKE